MLLANAANYQVLFCSGKGGVGKTTTATALAWGLSQQGSKVLLMSVDPAHNLGHIFNTRFGNTPQECSGLWVQELDPNQALQDYLTKVGKQLRATMPTHLAGEVDKHLRLAAQAPGAHESAIFEALAQLIVAGLADYDHIIVDTAPSGQTTRLLELPELLEAWVQGMLQQRKKAAHLREVVVDLGGDSGNMRRDQEIRATLYQRQQLFRSFREILLDSKRCGLVLVSTAERIPLQETWEFYQELQMIGIDIAGWVINRRTLVEGVLSQQRCDHEEANLQYYAAKIPLDYVQVPLLAQEIIGEQGLKNYLDAMY